MKPATMRPFNIHSGAHSDARSQRGLTLIEVMIAITISLVLLVGVMQIFTGSRQTYRVQDNMARLQENGRFAMDFLSKDIRMADYWGCLKNPSLNLANNLTGGGNGLGTVAGLAGTDGLNGAPDSIILAGAMPSNVSIRTAMPDPSASIPVTVPVPLAQGDIVIISNCANGDIFQISTINPNQGIVVGNTGAVTVPGNTFSNAGPTCPGGASNCLSAAYGTDAQLMIAQNIIYDIRPDATNIRPDGTYSPSLYRSASGIGVAIAPAQALVEGVENMQILYGEDLNGDRSADRYVSANTAGLMMNNVVSVRISLLLVTAENNLAITPQIYTFNGATVTAADRRLRRVFSSTIQLRNRV